jgi:hypothetical protein
MDAQINMSLQQFISIKMTSKAQLRIKYEPIQVREPYVADVKTFANPDEFTIYYREHENELKGLSTLRLNKTFKIAGYRISTVNKGRENEEIVLKKDYYGASKNDNQQTNSNNETDGQLAERISLLERKIDNIERFLQQLQI